ncbi:Protein of unknown function [Carboxydocella sporoproducens DSM 16521]|uniref:DUF445 domain-containing protein n=2 Tax=Carboxydocella TaxID=178898 RepID=A0A1T4Q0S6_9FIRM|nr:MULTISPECIES: DUF445 family protein [Carboxydocella]AVX21238.1 Protein of unknown function (DUF445) [Carboxydocella thermautotrophica]AVX31670.1 Protein of unknown function (DUF445) [Carboxydocella thermautotrophica]SJZ97121.1 Protein of unknown function [Carboxydocella sporoproducens DSM 16521]
MLPKWVVLPLIGALIGYATNYIAVRMLFRPRRAWHFPLINFTLQGLIPKRQAELARVIGQIVAEELLTAEKLAEELRQVILKPSVLQAINQGVKKRALEKLPSFLPLAMRTVAVELIGELVDKEIPALLGKTLDKLEGQVVQDLELARLVEEKVLALDLDQLEQLILKIAAQELRHIEVLGGVLGFFIGLLQILFI